jgi:hypothetical protein
MEYRITEKYVVQPSDFQGYTIEVTVGASHQDMGISDEELPKLTDQEHEEMWVGMKARVDDELRTEITSRLTRAANWSEHPNDLATKVIGGRNAATTKTRSTSSTGSRPTRRR